MLLWRGTAISRLSSMMCRGHSRTCSNCSCKAFHRHMAMTKYEHQRFRVNRQQIGLYSNGQMHPSQRSVEGRHDGGPSKVCLLELSTTSRNVVKDYSRLEFIHFPFPLSTVLPNHCS